MPEALYVEFSKKLFYLFEKFVHDSHMVIDINVISASQTSLSLIPRMTEAASSCYSQVAPVYRLL